MQQTFDPNISITELFSSKNVFITGATGFLGKVLVEKLLRSCPDIGAIYLLIREKKGVKIRERVEKMTQDVLFDKLRNDFPGVMEKKLIPLEGDCMQIGLGLSSTDRELIKSTVHIIYHVAANVRFDDSLKTAILLNTRGTQETCLLALESRQLMLLVHVSTTYCNCIWGHTLHEKLYPPPMDWRRAIAVAERCEVAELACLTDKILGPYPNTYTFTKSLAEHVVMDLCEGKIKSLICRPSIVVSMLNDPLVGWIDNFNGPMGLLIACGKGLMRCNYQNPDIHSDYIPVDITIKAIVVGTWVAALNKDNNKLEIVHCNSGVQKWMTIGEIIKAGMNISRESPFNDIIWIPKGFVSRCKYDAYLKVVLFHLLPAFILDFFIRISGRKPLLARLQTKIYNAAVQLRYFTMQEWVFDNQNMFCNLDKIIAKDRNDWDYDFRPENMDTYIRNSVHGARKYLLKESDESAAQAKKHSDRMYWVDKIAMFIYYLFIIWIIIYFNIVERFMNGLSNWSANFFILDKN